MYSIKAFVRFILFTALRFTPLVQYRAYHNPGGVGGYSGVWKLGASCIAFQQTDGVNQFRW